MVTGIIVDPHRPAADSLVWGKANMWLKGDFKDPTMFTPTHLQLNAYGSASVLKIRMNCRCDEVSLYAKPNDPFELWGDVGSSAKCIFRGRMVSENINGTGSDFGEIVCMDAIHEMDDEFVYLDIYDATAAFILRGLFEGFRNPHAPDDGVAIIEQKIFPAVCELGDDLSLLDKKKIDISCTGQNVVSCISQIFNALGGRFVWWIEPSQDGTNSVLRFVERGNGAPRLLVVGTGEANLTDGVNVSEINGTKDYSDIRNALVGWGGPKRYQETTSGTDESDTVPLERGWESLGIDQTTTIEAEVLEKPALVGKKDLKYKYVGRRFVIANDSSTWQKSKVLFKKLKSSYLSYESNGNETEFVDDELQLLVRYPKMVWESEVPGEDDIAQPDWQPYNGQYKIFWEHPVEEDKKKRTRSGAHNFRPTSKTLPNRVVVMLDAPACYDRYHNIRTIDNAEHYPEAERTDFAEFALTYAYQKDNSDESGGMGRLHVNMGKRGPFPRARKHLFKSDEFIYERIQSTEPKYKANGEMDGVQRTTETRDDTSEFISVLQDIAEESSHPDHRLSFTLTRCDLSWEIGQTIRKVKNLFNDASLGLVVESISIDLRNTRQTISTSDELRMA